MSHTLYKIQESLHLIKQLIYYEQSTHTPFKYKSEIFVSAFVKTDPIKAVIFFQN